MHWHGDGTAFTAPQFLSMASGDQVSILKLFQAEEIELAQILVLGAGIAGMPAAYALKSQLGPKDDVTVVSDQDHFHFVPSNPWVAMGWRKRPDISIPLAPCLDARGIRFIGSGVQALQPEKNQVLLDNGETLSYDYLLIATGIEGNFDEMPGIARHAHSVLNIGQAENTHAAYEAFLKNPGPLVVGAMQGSSILGPVYEFAFMADADLKRRHLRDRVPITLITPEPWPGHLGLGAKNKSQEAFAAALANSNIKVLSNARTLNVEANTVSIAEVDASGREKQPQTIPFSFAVYWPAFRGIPAVRAASTLVNQQGLIEVDEFLRSPSHPNIFAAGICIAREIVDQTPLAVGTPSSVYSIQKEVNTVAANILAQMHGKPLASNTPQRAHWLSDMGKNGAAYLSEPHVPLRDINWLKQGRWVHIAKVEFERYFINKITHKA